MKVVLQVYDLSNGIACSLSGALMGQTFEAVYHTGVSVDGQEYYYGGGGIQCDAVGTTPYGTPIEQIDMGETTKTLAEVTAYIDSVRPIFTLEKYDFIDHNCNHFSTAFLEFLCQKAVPERILNQGKEFLRTPLGRMAAPFLRSGLNPEVYEGKAPSAAPPIIPLSTFLPQGVSSTTKTTSIHIEEPLVLIPDQESLQKHVDIISQALGAHGNISDGVAFSTKFPDTIDATVARSIHTVPSELVTSLCSLVEEILTEEAGEKKDGEPSTETVITACLDALSCVCLSQKQDGIVEACMPLSLYAQHQTLLKSQAYLRYTINWLSQLAGMKDFRARSQDYLQLAIKVLDDSGLKVFGYRLLYVMSRIMTTTDVSAVKEMLFPILIQPIVEGAQATMKDSEKRTLYAQQANLASGALGRLIITAVDKQRPDGWYEAARKALKDLDLKVLKAPCCTDLQTYLQLDELAREELF
ncbi:PPPDE putative peptidase domain-containing protein [Giardia muris]|uniref:PPPDE putative peptidase domain-containing protein n=1 Tax=Giardia muris TaxID=5742 RepID=A0A4Z1SW93_GIAMU|nr:PPPDE putative peptidase domain-containing protein [Giardia muris]|eukprot:TNJ29145.1 PPPDE putative peptidase domain-containing protein [Giardia muris]